MIKAIIIDDEGPWINTLRILQEASCTGMVVTGNYRSALNCKSDSNYTTFFLDNYQKLTASQTLKEMETALEEHIFCGYITPT